MNPFKNRFGIYVGSRSTDHHYAAIRIDWREPSIGFYTNRMALSIGLVVDNKSDSRLELQLLRSYKDRELRRRGVSRKRAVRHALYYALVPSWIYEDKPHYTGWTYWQHARGNLRMAYRWTTARETESDIQFEKDANQ